MLWACGHKRFMPFHVIPFHHPDVDILRDTQHSTAHCLDLLCKLQHLPCVLTRFTQEEITENQADRVEDNNRRNAVGTPICATLAERTDKFVRR